MWIHIKSYLASSSISAIWSSLCQVDVQEFCRGVYGGPSQTPINSIKAELKASTRPRWTWLKLHEVHRVQLDGNWTSLFNFIKKGVELQHRKCTTSQVPQLSQEGLICHQFFICWLVLYSLHVGCLHHHRSNCDTRPLPRFLPSTSLIICPRFFTCLIFSSN